MFYILSSPQVILTWWLQCTWKSCRAAFLKLYCTLDSWLLKVPQSVLICSKSCCSEAQDFFFLQWGPGFFFLIISKTMQFWRGKTESGTLYRSLLTKWALTWTPLPSQKMLTCKCCLSMKRNTDWLGLLTTIPVLSLRLSTCKNCFS